MILTPHQKISSSIILHTIHWEKLGKKNQSKNLTKIPQSYQNTKKLLHNLKLACLGALRTWIIHKW